MNFCAGCDNAITGNLFLFAINSFWHEDCLRCVCCKCRLIDQNDHFYSRDGLSLCAWHYVRLFGLGGVCHLCAGRIGPAEWVVSVSRSQTSPVAAAFSQSQCSAGHQPQQKCVFHLQCFACAECNARFCVGDPFAFSANGKVFCKRHFQQMEKMNE